MNGVVTAPRSAGFLHFRSQASKIGVSGGFIRRSSSYVENPSVRLCCSSSNFAFLGVREFGVARGRSLRCGSSSKPDGPGENESRTVLDAFFLGKALAEVVNERIESTVGEVFSAIGRLQAEQQKQIQEIQEEVLERARRARQQAAREAWEAQGLASKTNTVNSTSVVNNTTLATSPQPTNVETHSSSSSSSQPTADAPAKTNPDHSDEDPVTNIPISD